MLFRSPVIEKPVEQDDPSVPVPLDAPCKRLGCKAVYKGVETYEVPCIHHPGVPIFHEGLSQWVALRILLSMLPANLLLCY